MSGKLKLSMLKILLKNNILRSKNKINNKNIKKNIKKEVITLILIENLNISFDAIEVIYINKINIPPKKIKNNE